MGIKVGSEQCKKGSRAGKWDSRCGKTFHGDTRDLLSGPGKDLHLTASHPARSPASFCDGHAELHRFLEHTASQLASQRAVASPWNRFSAAVSLGSFLQVSAWGMPPSWKPSLITFSQICVRCPALHSYCPAFLTCCVPAALLLVCPPPRVGAMLPVPPHPCPQLPLLDTASVLDQLVK